MRPGERLPGSRGGGGLGEVGGWPSPVRFRCPRGPSRTHAAAAGPFPLHVRFPRARAALDARCVALPAPCTASASRPVWPFPRPVPPGRAACGPRACAILRTPPPRWFWRACAAFPAARTLPRPPPPAAGPGAAEDAALLPRRARVLRRPLCSRPASRGGAPGALLRARWGRGSWRPEQLPVCRGAGGLYQPGAGARVAAGALFRKRDRTR